MGRKDKPESRDADGEPGDFVPAVFARSIEEAEDYRQLLDDHDIPAIVADEEQAGATAPPGLRKGFSRGVPVLVPEAMLEEAGEVIAERDETDAFGLDEDEEESEDEAFALDGTEPENLEAEGTDQEEDDQDEADRLEDEDLFGEEGEEGEDDDKEL